MNITSVFCLIVLLSGVALCEENVAGRTFAEAFNLNPEQMRNVIIDAQKVLAQPQPAAQPQIEVQHQVQACTPLGTPPDTDDISKLRPGNVRVLAAIGDSITTGMSINDTSFLSLKDYRGLSFCMGGDKFTTTLGSLLQQFSPPLIGLSTGVGFRESVGTGFNGAVDGAIAQDMLAQAVWLVERIQKNLTEAQFGTYWKVVTIWIGSNNLCDFCNEKTKHGADAFEASLDAALAYLQKNLPRTFVNLISNLDVTQIYSFKEGLCGTLHPYACPCGASSNAATRAAVQAETAEYIKRVYNLQAKFVPTKTFAVVVQPFLEQAILPSRSWLSAADCFHPSLIAHKAMAVGLWNNMITPKASKSNKLIPDEQVICATPDTYITLQ